MTKPDELAWRDGSKGRVCVTNAATKAQRTPTVLDMKPDQFAEGSAARLLWRICASDRCPGLINGEAKLCEAFHSEALDVLANDAALMARIAELEAALRACVAAHSLVGAAKASASDKLYGPDGIARAALKGQA